MQLHQTTTLPTPVLPLSVPTIVIGIVMLILVSACSSAGEYKTEVSAIDSGNTDPRSGADPAPVEYKPPTPVTPADERSVPSGAPTERLRPPVLEVTDQTGDGSVGSPEAPTNSTGTDATKTADDQPAAVAAPTEAATGSSQTPPATDGQPADTPPAANPTQPPATRPSDTGPPETMTTSPPVTDPPATEAPSQTTPPATDPPATEAPVIEDPLAEPKPSEQSGPEPNCAVLCNIAMEGDSLTVGLGNRLCGAVQTGNCINSGIVGRRVDEMIVTARTDVDNQVGTDGNDVLILWGGTNDLWQKYHSTDPATNAAAIYEQIKTFVAERRANGWDYVYVMTLPPMNPTYVVGTEPLNDLIRQNQAGANGVLDVGADPRLANAFDPAMRAADGIHFGDGGRAVVMEYVLGAIRGLDGA